MALDNLISIEFTQLELDDISTALTSISNILAGKVINLTPEERQRYARVSYEMIPWVEKCQGYMQTNPTLVPGYIDTAELNKDIKTRQQDMQPRFTILRSVYESFDDTMLLMGNDIYNNCIAFYRAVKAASQANVPGSTSIYEDLAQQFPGRPSSTVPEEPPV
jgi:hypothetical protein